MEDIHDILAPFQVGMDPVFIKTILAVSAGFILAALLYALIRYFLKKRKDPSKDILLLPPPLPPLAAALKAIRDLENHQGPDLRAFYFQLTAILKKYMGRVFLFHAAEMTTQEFIKAIYRFDLEKNILNQMIELMDGSDRIKYAGETPLKQMIHDDLERTRTIIIHISELHPPEDGHV